MGYAVFAARKIMLTTRINTLNFRIMCLSQRQQSLSEQSGLLGQAFSQYGMQLNSLFQNGGVDMMNNGAGAAGNQLNQQAYLQQYAPGGAYQQMMQYVNYLQQSMLQPISQMENQIETERKRLETQVQAAQAELQSVEKAEQEAIKNSAPKFA